MLLVKRGTAAQSAGAGARANLILLDAIRTGLYRLCRSHLRRLDCCNCRGIKYLCMPARHMAYRNVARSKQTRYIAQDRAFMRRISSGQVSPTVVHAVKIEMLLAAKIDDLNCIVRCELYTHVRC